MDTTTQWALFLGGLTLASWILAGIAAVLSAGDGIDPGAERLTQRVSLSLHVLGSLSAAAMVAILVVA